jgi:hypothetical protein
MTPKDLRRQEGHFAFGENWSLGFGVKLVFEKPAAIAGLLGSPCNEFVAVRRT